MNIIAVVDNKWGIGKNNSLLFNIPEDMAFFKESTLGKIVVMGKNTFFSLPAGPLKNRTNIVFSSTMRNTENVVIAKDIFELKKILVSYDLKDIFIIGGSQFYKTMLEYCDIAYITKVDADGNAESFLENLDTCPNWICREERKSISTKGYSLCFCTYENISVKSF